MNTQRWIAVGVGLLLVACIATSNLWLGFFADDDDEEMAAATATAEADLAALEAREADTEGTPEPEGQIVGFDEIIAGDMEAAATEEVDPLIADLLAALEQESLGVGEEPVVIRAGDFIALDAQRQAEGVATIYQIGDTRRVLRLEPFRVTNGPDLRVLLSEDKTPRTGAEALQPSFIDLGPLQSIDDVQNYAIEQEVDLDKYRSVVIYSMSLNIIYTTAPLEVVRS